MLQMPNRLLDAVRAMEQGQPVDWGRLASLQQLDLASLGRQALESAVREQEQADDECRQLLERLSEGDAGPPG